MTNIDLYSTCTVVFFNIFNDLLRYISASIELNLIYTVDRYI